MSERFPIGTWFYHDSDAFPPEEVDIWNNCGLTYTLSPRVSVRKKNIETIIPYLDKAASYDMKLIAFVDDLGCNDYREDFIYAYNILKGHPALGGFFVMDEPNTRDSMEKAIECFKIQKEIAPELDPFLNLTGSTNSLIDEMGYGSMENLMKRFADVGCRKICFDSYSQTINYNAIDFFFDEVIPTVAAAKANGIEPWICPLCTGHYSYQVPTEYMIFWQINVPVACGCRGIIWFRYYDRDICINNHGSPIDQYHNLTDHYYMMMRAQRTFLDHYGDMFLKLRHKKTYCLGRHYNSIPYFEEDCHDLIKLSNYLDSIVSFFEDEEGKEYMAVVNASYEETTQWPLHFDEDKCSVIELTFNGKNEHKMHSLDYDDETFLFPGQMMLYRIDRK